MEPYIFDNKNGLWYELRGGYYYPCLTLPDEGEYHIGIWGERHRRYLEQEHKFLYETLLLKGTLYSYLADVDTQAEKMLLKLIVEMVRREGISEQLKADDQMAWVGAMNNIRARAEEVVNAELIYN